MARPKIVIIGGGLGGTFTAQSLNDVADCTIVERRHYIEIPSACVRVAVDPSTGDKICIPYSEIPKLGEVVVCPATTITDSSVLLLDGRELPYDYLVVATGSTYKSQLYRGTKPSVADRRQEYHASNKLLRWARSVLVIGGGPVGVEIAAEVCTAFPEKRVILVHSKDRLISDYKERVGGRVQDFLESKGVEVLLNDRVVQDAWGRYMLQKSGQHLETDLIYWCTGGTVNSSVLQPDHLDVLDASGQVMVDEFLRVKGRPNWFACGDVIDVEEKKLGRNTSWQGALVGSNISALMKKGPHAQLTAWKPNGGMDALFLSLGRNDGIAQLLGFVFGGPVPVHYKSKDLSASMMRRKLGLNA